MPVYQYACTECGEELEARQSFTDDALTVCPACSGRLRKVLTAVGVVFKGSGFYRNDSRAAAPSGEAGTTTTTVEKSGSSASESGSSSNGSGDSGSASTEKGSGGKGSSSKDASPGSASQGSASPGRKSSPRSPSGGSKPAPAAAR